MVIHPLVENSFNKIYQDWKLMKLSQLTLAPHHSCYTCSVQVVYYTCFLHSSVLFGISSTAAQYQTMWRTTSADSTISRRLSPSWHPCGALFFMYLLYASALLEPILDSVVIKIFIYNLHAFTLWYVLWYLDNSVVYMRDLILVHIWLLGLCPCKSGVTELVTEPCRL
jgi:hypothetical protein